MFYRFNTKQKKTNQKNNGNAVKAVYEKNKTNVNGSEWRKIWAMDVKRRN